MLWHRWEKLKIKSALLSSSRETREENQNEIVLVFLINKRPDVFTSRLDETSTQMHSKLFSFFLAESVSLVLFTLIFSICFVFIIFL